MLENQAFPLFGRGVGRLIFLYRGDGSFDRPLCPHAATTSNFESPAAGEFRIKSSSRSTVAGSRSSGIRWPRERKETGFFIRMLLAKMGPNVSVSSRRVKSSLEG